MACIGTKEVVLGDAAPMWFPVILFHLLLFLLLLVIKIPALSAALCVCVCVEERARTTSFWPLLYVLSDIAIRDIVTQLSMPFCGIHSPAHRQLCFGDCLQSFSL